MKLKFSHHNNSMSVNTHPTLLVYRTSLHCLIRPNFICKATKNGIGSFGLKVLPRMVTIKCKMTANQEVSDCHFMATAESLI